LDPKWENISKKYKYDLSTILGQILCNFHLTRNHVEAIRACHFLLSVLKSPWDHHYLSKLLFGDPSQEEGNVLKYENYILILWYSNIK